MNDVIAEPIGSGRRLISRSKRSMAGSSGRDPRGGAGADRREPPRHLRLAIGQLGSHLGKTNRLGAPNERFPNTLRERA